MNNIAGSRTVEIAGVGTVLIERSRRAMRLVISIRQFAGVRVAVPYGVPFEKAEHFVLSRISWIGKHLAKMERHEREHQAIKSARSETDLVEAGIELTDRLGYLAEKHGFRYNRVFIRNQRTRWGSCSVKNNISLNVNLVRLSPELMDYVILHELVHTQIKNHSSKFWDELDKFVGSGKIQARKVKQYGALIL